MLTNYFWRKYFKHYDNLNLIEPYQELMQTLIQTLEIKQGNLILDAGAGTGNLGEKIEKAGGIVVGFDSSEFGLSIHKIKTPKAKLIVGNLLNPLPFQDNYFDKICSNNTLYMISKTKRIEVIKEFFRILKPGGKIVIANMMHKSKPHLIYLFHIRSSVSNNGVFKTFLEIFKFLVPTVKMFYYTFRIRITMKNRSVKYLNNNEQADLLKSAGFVDISNDILVYAQQAIMNSAIKP